MLPFNKNTEYSETIFPFSSHLAAQVVYENTFLSHSPPSPFFRNDD